MNVKIPAGSGFLSPSVVFSQNSSRSLWQRFWMNAYACRDLGWGIFARASDWVVQTFFDLAGPISFLSISNRIIPSTTLSPLITVSLFTFFPRHQTGWASIHHAAAWHPRHQRLPPSLFGKAKAAPWSAGQGSASGLITSRYFIAPAIAWKGLKQNLLDQKFSNAPEPLNHAGSHPRRRPIPTAISLCRTVLI